MTAAEHDQRAADDWLLYLHYAMTPRDVDAAPSYVRTYLLEQARGIAARGEMLTGDAFVEAYFRPELLSSDTVSHDRLVKAMNPKPSRWRRLLNAWASGPLRDTGMATIGGLLVAGGFALGVWAAVKLGLVA